MRSLPSVRVETSYTKFSGGLDVTTPPLDMPAGRCRDSNNVYQGPNGGYVTGTPYERFDGQTAPSSATYAILAVTITGTVVVGDILTDDATTSFGTVIALTDTEAILTKVTGTFSTGNIKVLGSVVGTCVGEQVVEGASTRKLNATYMNLAADEYRGDITAVTGSGDLTGIWYYDGTWYGFRNNAGGTASAMYKSSASGWVLVDLGRELAFTSGGGAYQVKEGDTIEGETGGATAVVTRVIVRSGTLVAGDAVGTLTFASQTGTFQAETIKVGANLDVATIAGDSSALAFDNPNGTFRFINANFTGVSSTRRVYGVDGVNRAFEFDGTVFAPIYTGMTTDTPSHVYEHKYHLFLSFDSSSQHSAPGEPYQWSLVVGADELGLGDQVTGYISMPGGETSATLAMFTRNSIAMLYGNSVADWNLVHYKKEAGAIEGSAQLIGNTFMLDDRGIVKLSTSQAYGNFSDATESQLIQPWLATKKTILNTSCVVRDMNQYWLFFSDKTALCCTVDNGEIVASMPMSFPHEITCACSTEDTSGNEVVMLGSSEGYVYQLYKGTSFDGEPLEWYLSLAYDFFKSPTVNKRFRKSTFEVSGTGYAEFNFSYELSYGSTDVAQPSITKSAVSLSPEYWDSFTWDNFIWDGASLLPSGIRMTGSGTNMSIQLSGNCDCNTPLKFSGALVQYNKTKEFI
jgi:hypothetical protein